MTDLPFGDADLSALNGPHLITWFYGHLKVVDGATYLDMGERGTLPLLPTGILQEYRQGIVEAGMLDEEVSFEGQRVLMQLHFLDVQGKEQEG